MAVKRILAVENNELVLSFLQDGLTSAGYDVDTATNGREALEKIDRRAYDVIISDLCMPELDGVGLCLALGEWSPAVRRLVVLTDPEILVDHQAFLDEAGVRAALAKPVELEELRSVVQRVIGEPDAVLSGADRR